MMRTNEKITDFISEKKIKITPEEVEAVQPFSKTLVNDYKYPKENIQTRPQFRVKSIPSSRSKSFPIDIGVFNSYRKDENDLYIIVECKNKKQKADLSQLRIYMEMSTAQFGIWYNGEEKICLYKDQKNKRNKFIKINDIPLYEQHYEDIGKFKKEHLIVPFDLKIRFNDIRHRLAGSNVGATRDESIAHALINLIFCKIYDERYTHLDLPLRFCQKYDEKPITVQKRIESLFEKVKSEYQDVIDSNEVIGLDADSVFYVVGQLQNFMLSKASRNVISDAFETFIGKSLKGESGQFFTPKNVVNAVVKILNPNSKSKIIDPACGSGGFLTESVKHIWKQIESEGKELGWNKNEIIEEQKKSARKNIVGIDKDRFLTKITKAYMALIGDGRGNVFCENSLKKIPDFSHNNKNKIKLASFDYVMTNPPFGKNIKIVDKEILEQYDLAHQWTYQENKKLIKGKFKKDIQPQILFIERCIQLLKPGGVLAIVLPETIFHAPSLKYILDWVKIKCNITGVIDLPEVTFQPYAGVKPCVLIAQKKSDKYSNRQDIVLATVDNIGHDHRGVQISAITNEKFKDDLPSISNNWNSPNKNYNVLSLDIGDIVDNIYIPRYYRGKYNTLSNSIYCHYDYELVSIKELIDSKEILAFNGIGSAKGELKSREGGAYYLRTSDIVNYELYRNPTTFIPIEEFKANITDKNKFKLLKEGDLLMVRRGGKRIGDVAMVSPYDATEKILYASELLNIRVINCTRINPYLLMYLFSGKFVKAQIRYSIFFDTHFLNLGNRYLELQLLLPRKEETRNSLTSQIKDSILKRWGSLKQLRTTFIESNEKTEI